MVAPRWSDALRACSEHFQFRRAKFTGLRQTSQGGGRLHAKSIRIPGSERKFCQAFRGGGLILRGGKLSFCKSKEQGRFPRSGFRQRFKESDCFCGMTCFL